MRINQIARQSVHTNSNVCVGSMSTKETRARTTYADLLGKELRAKTKKAVLTCTGAFQRNASEGNSQVSGFISRDGRSLAVSTPGTRHTDDQVERRKGEAQLSPTMTTVFRFCVMRASFLSQDRAGFGEALKSLAQQMSRHVDDCDGGCQVIGTLLAWQAIFGFEIRTAANASKNPCLSRQ